MRPKTTLVFGCALLFAFAARAHRESAPPSAAANAPATIEEIDQVEPVTPTAAKLTAVDIIGRLHPALVHFPIGWLLALAVIDALTFLGGRAELAKAGSLLLLGSLASFVPAIGTGLLRAKQLPVNPRGWEEIAEHRNVMLATAALTAICAVLRWAKGGPLAGARKHAYLGFVLVAALMVLVGGHLGAALVFGEDYLPF